MKTKSLFFSAFVSLCALTAGVTTSAVAKDAPVVDAPAGKLRGVHEGDTTVFRAIPYALPPTGDRRFRAPDPMPRWKGVRGAQQVGPACMQPPMAMKTVSFSM